jgi:hypothetical protein
MDATDTTHDAFKVLEYRLKELGNSRYVVQVDYDVFVIR